MNTVTSIKHYGTVWIRADEVGSFWDGIKGGHTMNIEMMNNKLLVKKLPPPKELDGILTTIDQNLAVFDVEVMAAPKGSSFNTGDVLIMSQYAGEDVIVDNQPYYILDEENVWARKA